MLGESPSAAIRSAMAVLVYETEDDEFVDRALEELSSAGIRCYRFGPATVGDGSFRGRTGAMASIYIERASDYLAANEILIKLGAVQDKPLRLPSSQMARIALIALFLALLGCMVFLFRSG
jgi:hypothetical protein